MDGKVPNEGLARLLAETGWTYGHLVRRVNGVATKSGKPTRYDNPSVKQWLDGTMPRKAVRSFVLEAFSRHLKRPVSTLRQASLLPKGLPSH